MKADQDIIKEVLAGARTAFSQLVSRHQKAMLRVALRMTRDLEMAEDIVQDSFIKAYQKLASFEGRASFRSWMYQITINTAKNKLRSRRSEHMDIEKADLAVSGRAEARVVQSDLKHLLHEEVSRLPAKQREALTLRIYDELSFKEIAVIMECPYDTAKANYRHGLMKLRHRFQESLVLRQFKDLDFTLPAVFQARPMEVKV